MSKTNRLAFNVAFCGIVSALAAIVMLGSLIPSMAYAVPALAGMVIWTITEHMSVKWAYLSFAAVSLLSLMIVPEIEANMFFIFFFGYYPIVCIHLEKINNKLVRFLLKLLIFNVSVVIAYNILTFLLSAEEMLEGLEDLGQYALYIFWGAGNVAFVIYDMCLSVIKQFYIKMLKPKIKSKLK